MVESSSTNDLPALAGELARGFAAVVARLAQAAPAARPDTPQHSTASGLLTVDEAAARLGVPKSWLYRHAKELPFTRKLGHRTLRFDAAGLDRWLVTRRAL